MTQIADVTALCSLAAYDIFYRSATNALSILEGCSPNTGCIPGELRHRIWVLRGLSHLRLAHWDEAEYASRKALEVAQLARDTLQIASALNNLACIAIERGAWDEAEKLNQRTKALHEALNVALDATLPIRMNAANLEFYRGQAKRASELYSSVREVAKEHGLPEFLAELEACIGLTALQAGQRSLVLECWANLQEWQDTELRGVQERFKIEWFRAYMRRSGPPEEVVAGLRAAADEQRKVDYVDYLKLLWLENLLAPKLSSDARSLQSQLSEAGLAWFCRFSRRWLRLVEDRDPIHC